MPTEPIHSYSRTQVGRYEVTGWSDGPWWVSASNGKTVATCAARRTALRIARLLDADRAPAASHPASPSPVVPEGDPKP